MTPIEERLRVTHELPPGRDRMRYLHLSYPLGDDGSKNEHAVILCYSCENKLFATTAEQSLAGLAVKCPHCGTVSAV